MPAETPYRREPGYAARYRDRRFAAGSGPATHRRELQLLRELVADAMDGQPGDGTWLDAPSGAGRMSGMLPGRVVQLDRDRAMLRAATRADGGAVQGSVHALPFADRVFAGVLCLRLLQHLPEAGERVRVLTELARVSRGPVVLSYFEARSLPHLRRLLRRRLGKPRSGRGAVAWSRLRAELRAAGLDPVRRRPLRPLGLSEQTLVLATVRGEREAATRR